MQETESVKENYTPTVLVPHSSRSPGWSSRVGEPDNDGLQESKKPASYRKGVAPVHSSQLEAPALSQLSLQQTQL